MPQRHFAWFLIFISLLTSSSAWYAIRVWRFKNRKDIHKDYRDIVVSATLLFSSIFMSVYGHYYKQSLFAYFPFIHNDSFDRILIIQAKMNNLILMTPNKKFSKYPVIILKA